MTDANDVLERIRKAQVWAHQQAQNSQMAGEAAKPATAAALSVHTVAYTAVSEALSQILDPEE